MVVRAAACVFACVPLIAIASPAASEGHKLVQAHMCETCHQNKVYGPEGTIYTRKDHKVTSWAKLRAQVAGCSSQLNLGLFPEEEEQIATYLNETYYKLPVK